jgi:regulator of protease activity HflC (stomatin/prohibitin superfamily)
VLGTPSVLIDTIFSNMFTYTNTSTLLSQRHMSHTLTPQDYGYEILTTLVTDLAPDSKVKASMNEINASRRLKEAASHKAEADKVKQVKAAEAEAEARYLSGLGVARQRKAIVQGLQASVSEFSQEVEGSTPKDVMDIL